MVIKSSPCINDVMITENVVMRKEFFLWKELKQVGVLGRFLGIQGYFNYNSSS